MEHLNKTIKIVAVCFLTASTLLIGCKSPKESSKDTVAVIDTINDSLRVDFDSAYAYCAGQIDKSLASAALQDIRQHARAIEDGQEWHTNEIRWDWWTVGFYPGVLWYAYEATGNQKYLTEAIRRTEVLEEFKTMDKHHDIGFMLFCSYGNGYRLTSNPKYKDVLITAAQSLASLYNPNVGTIKSWDNGMHPQWKGHITIIDNMMNLELLYWAAQQPGADPKFAEIATKHAQTTMENHFRPDYTSYHVVEYDPQNGAVLNRNTAQGAADESTWARGQSWAVYGYPMVYRFTGDKKFLDFAVKVTDKFIENLPSDMVPWWDFSHNADISQPRDASAAAIAACGMYELSMYVEDPALKVKYVQTADRILDALSSPEYWAGQENHAILLHSTGNKPGDSEVDCPIIYADYYYLEALLKRQKLLEQGTAVL